MKTRKSKQMEKKYHILQVLKGTKTSRSKLQVSVQLWYISLFTEQRKSDLFLISNFYILGAEYMFVHPRCIKAHFTKL